MNCSCSHKIAMKCLLQDTTNNQNTNRNVFAPLHQTCCDSPLHAPRFLHEQKAKKKQNTNAELWDRGCLLIVAHSISDLQDKCVTNLRDPFSRKEYLSSQALHTAARFAQADIVN